MLERKCSCEGHNGPLSCVLTETETFFASLFRTVDTLKLPQQFFSSLRMDVFHSLKFTEQHGTKIGNHGTILRLWAESDAVMQNGLQFVVFASGDVKTNY